MAHVRRKFVDALQTDHRSADIINLISNLYWVEADCRINLLSEDERRMERQKRAIPILAEIWQMIKPVFDQTRGDTANLLLKAVRYAVNEWEAVSRYVQNGKAEIDNNTAESSDILIVAVYENSFVENNRISDYFDILFRNHPFISGKHWLCCYEFFPIFDKTG